VPRYPDHIAICLTAIPLISLGSTGASEIQRYMILDLPII
jgi:hypothetical protein